MDPFEVTPEEKMAALADALRQRQGQPQAADFYRGWGNMDMQSGDRVLTNFGNSQIQQAQQMDRGDGAMLLKLLAGGRGGMAKSPEELDNLSATASLKRAKAAQLGVPKPAKDTSFDDETSLRKEVSNLPETKALVDAEASYNQILNAADNATGDVARIYALAKTFDPGGRVTDSDYSAAKQGQGPMARFGGLINEVEGKGMLSQQSRENMKATARQLIERRRADYAITRSRFEEITKKRGLNPRHVIVRPDHSKPDIDLAAPPKSATVATPADEAEYNALPSGSLYVGPEGKTHKKP